ncbi:hypothetical protein [Laspinema olomoucense]|uniref:hypothetical protein n=1 Tax=Laspinema olomoucense TaxID=3231600 RepID=UPI0021BA4B98|nr:hypothetical protein [Laspinema sp. D3d]MCT7971208.1 hypothetical protein [Laspinema sp. D3d]
MSEFAQWAQSVSNYWRSEYTSQGVFDHSDIEEYQKQGYYVVYESVEICCPETDGTLGYATSILKQEDGSLALFLNKEQAQEFAKENNGFCAKPTSTHRPTPKPKLRASDQPRATDAVLGGRGNQPHSTDAVLGNSITTIRQQLFSKLKRKGGTPQEWSKLAILDSELGYSIPQSQVKPYLNAWNKSIK